MKAKRKNPTYRQKARLLQESGNSCAFCDFSEDAGIIEFHHINNDPSDTVLKNLICICPNCHSSVTEGVISLEEVKQKKKKLENQFRKKKKEENSQIEINNSTLNNSVIGDNNSLTINNIQKVTKKKVEKYPKGSIGYNVIMYNYAHYLAGRYSEYKTWELKNSGQKFNYGRFFAKVKKDFKSSSFYLIPETRFLELVDYLQKRIDRTMLAKINRSKGNFTNYMKLDEYKKENEKKT